MYETKKMSIDFIPFDSVLGFPILLGNFARPFDSPTQAVEVSRFLLCTFTKVYSQIICINTYNSTLRQKYLSTKFPRSIPDFITGSFVQFV
jgi:hypothetical protein